MHGSFTQPYRWTSYMFLVDSYLRLDRFGVIEGKSNVKLIWIIILGLHILFQGICVGWMGGTQIEHVKFRIILVGRLSWEILCHIFILLCTYKVGLGKVLLFKGTTFVITNSCFKWDDDLLFHNISNIPKKNALRWIRWYQFVFELPTVIFETIWKPCC